MTRRLRRVVAACLAGLMILSTGEQILAAGPTDSSAAAVDAQVQENVSTAVNTGDNTNEKEKQTQTDDADQTGDADQTDGGTLSEAPASGDGQADTSDGKTDDQSESKPADWSSRKDAFLFSYEQLTQDEEDGWTLSVQFSFPLKDTEETVREGDTAVLQLPTEWMEIEDTKEKASLSPFIEKTDGEEKTEEAVDVPIAEYEIKDGTVKLTFTDGIESDEIVSQITELKTRLTVPFIWKEGVQTEEEQQVTWTLQTYEDDSKNEADLVIPALEKEQDEKQSDEKKTEEKKTEKSVNTAALLGAATLADSSYTMSSQKYEGKSEERHIYWIDNNDGQKTRPSFSSTISETDRNNLRFSATFTYTVGSETKTETLTDLTWAQVSTATTTTTSTITMTDLGGTGHWVLSASNLLSSANVTIDGTSRAGTFSDWTISTTDDDIFANDKYASVFVTGENTDRIPVDQEGRPRPSAEDRRGWFYVQKLDYTSKIHLRTGTKTEFDQDELDNLKKAILAEYSFFWKTGIKGTDGNDLNSGSTALDASPNWMTITWDDSGDHLVGTVTVPALEKYNLDGSELIFYVDGDGGKDVTITVPEMETGDYLAESVVNDNVSNWGTNVTEVYSGGDLILTLTGTTEYTATKEWHDKADPDNRPQVDFYLWRFTDKGTETNIDTAYQTAAAVKATNGGHEGQTAQVTIPEKSSGETFAIDFFRNFKDENGDVQPADYLPKYDPEGYRYVYICREYMSGDDASRYKTVYGKLVNDAFEDTLPTGYTAPRTAYDNSIYNGGTVSNLLTGTTTASVTKTWVANAFQSELEDTIVELTLYSRVKTDNDSAQWTATSTTYRMGDKSAGGTPFIAEFLTQSHSETMPKYNNEGEELEYCWVETGVYQGSGTTNLLDPSTSTTDKTFTLTQKGQTVKYKSQSEYKQNTDGTYSTTITNRIEDTTNYYVRKEWDESITNRTPVSLRMYRTGINNEQQRLSTTSDRTTDFRLDGQADAEPTPLYYDRKQVGQVQETSPWYAEYTNLDKYDDNGSQYDFIVFEGNPGSWTPEYSTTQDAQGNTIRVIKNTPGPGPGTTLLLRKRWLDDGDEQHRGTVTYTIYNIPKASRGNITSDVLSSENVKVQEVTIGRSDEWWKQVYLENVTDDDGLLVLETSVASTDGGNPVPINYTAEKLNEIFALQHASSDTSGSAPYVSYETTYHRYEASYSMVKFEGNTFYTVTNRRLGNIDIKVTKTWKDGSTTGQVSEQREAFIGAIEDAGYELVFQLVTNSPDVVTVDYENNTVTAGNEAVPILKADGKTKAEAIQKLKTDTISSVYEFYNLPKYDSMGRMVSYRVEEMLRKTSDGSLATIESVIESNKIDTDYSFTITQSGYTVSQGRKHDKQTFSAVNQLTGSKDVFFWKEWNDAYRYQLGERPDLYLDLYEVKHNKDGTEKTPESRYLDRRWQFKDEWISLCDFGSMPKYDEYGFEIIYYAQEKILINKDAFDYTDVYYKYSTEMESKDVLASGQISAQEDLNAHVNELDKIGDESGPVSGSGAVTDGLIKSNGDSSEPVYLLKEYGIFVNELQADVVFNGKKIWANIPSGFLDADLAEVTFRLYQFESGNEPDNDSNNQTVEEGKYYLEGKNGTKSPEYAWITITNWNAQKYNNEYKFAIQYRGGNTNTVGTDGTITVTSTDEKDLTIPKYDEDGNLYAYVIRESGDFSGTDVGDDHSLIFKQPTINNFAITNPYDSVKGKITVKKLLDTSSYTAGTVKNPSVSFTLTRQYYKNSGDENSLIEEKGYRVTKTIPYSDFVDGSATLEFTDLEIYAPNGNKYVYTIEENENDLIQGGYVVSAGIGNLDKDDSGLIGCTNGEYKVTGLYPKRDASAGQQLLDFFKSIPQLLGITPKETDTSYATFKNTYKPGLVPLYFGKNWSDLNNEAGVRPKSLTFGVQREAASQPGQNNGIGNTTLGEMKITIPDDAWNDNQSSSVTLTENNGLKLTDNTSGTNYQLGSFIKKVTVKSNDGKPLGTASGWIIKVESVYDFAPNGMPWTYKLQEKLGDDVWKYTGTGTIVLNYVAPTEGEQYGHFGNETSPTSVTNSLSTSTKFWKNWRYDDAVNQKFKNPLGYAMELDVSLYFAAVELKADGTIPSDKDFNNANWGRVEDDSNSNFKNALNRYYVNQTGKDTTYVQTISYAVNSDLGVREGGISKEFTFLPKVVKVDDVTYAMRYYAIETALRLKDSDTVIYEESFTPNFVELNDQKQGAAKKYGGTSRVGYWLETKAKIMDFSGSLSDTNELLVTPRVDSQTDLYTVWDKDFYQVFDSGIDQYTDKAVWPVVNYDDSKRESTNINDLDLTKLDVKKTWENDSGNIYGTREPNGTSGWKLTFQLQRAISGSGDTWQSVDGKTVTVTGDNSTDNGTETFTHLPVKVLEKNEQTGGYSINAYKYRARELDNNNVVTAGGTYRDAYKASYTDGGDADDGYTTSATNTMDTIDRYAKKYWKDISLTSPVTLELQYQKKDENWASFQTKAIVTLDGTADTDTTKAYYEDSAWHAVWNGVPKVMTGSKTTGENDTKQTIYRVVEVTENAYGTDGNGNALPGSGTQDAPYVLENPATGNDDYSITNELTILKVEKTVEKYVEGAAVEDEFAIKISGNMSGITVKYQKYTKADSGDTKDGNLVTASISNNSFTFNLKDNQYVLIYGLKKRVTYTVEETNAQGYTPSYQVTAADAASPADGNTVTIPATKPTATSPVVTVTNKRYGKLTVEKKDESGAPLSRVTFKLMSSSTENGPWSDVKGGEKTTGTDGKVVYENLELKKYYQITETAVPSGYNKLEEPVVVYLPYETTSNTSGSNPLYTISSGSDTKYYYADVTITIGNNKTLVMPTTAGAGFFWPGIAGLFVLAVGGGFYLYTGRRRRRKSS